MKRSGSSDKDPLINSSQVISYNSQNEEQHQYTVNSTRTITADDILNFIGFGPFQIIAFFLAGMTYFAYGIDASIFVFIGDSIRSQWHINTTEYTILPAATAIPNVFGAFLFSFLTDRFGRLWPYAVCLTWIGVFSIASSFANSFPLLVALRCTTSLGIGAIAGLTFPTLIEFLPVRNRAKVAILNMLVAIVGLCASCGLAWWLIPSYPIHGWRYYVLAAGIPSLFVAVYRLAFHFESPRFLIATGKLDKAWNIFGRIARINGKDLNDFVSRDEFHTGLDLTQSTEVIVQVNIVKKQPFIFIQLLQIFRPKYLRRTLPLAVVVVTESFGYLCSQLFIIDFLKRVGDYDTYFTILVSSVAQIPGFLLLSNIVEWQGIGRLNSLRLFSAMSAIFFLLLAFIQTKVSVPVLMVFIYFSTAPILGHIYTYISEVYPTSIRAVSTAFFYVLQALAYMIGAFISGHVFDVPQHWLFPVVWACTYAVQFCAALVLNYEPYGRKLMDVFE